MQRLGKNSGRYHGESIDIDAVQKQIQQLALASGWIQDVILSIPQIEISAYRRIAPKSTKNLYLASGIHGDEPAGPLAILELFKQNDWPDVNIWLVPCTNPTGFRLNTRENYRGVDLNRDFRQPVTHEITAHVEWLKRQPQFDLSLLLHEDWEANGFYVYELNPQKRSSLAETIVEAVRELCPIETSELVDSFACHGGIIRPFVDPMQRPQWAEAIYLIVHHSRQTYTLETPSDFPLPFRVRAQLMATWRAFQLFVDETASNANKRG